MTFGFISRALDGFGVFKGSSFIPLYQTFTQRFNAYREKHKERARIREGKDDESLAFYNQNVRFFACDSYEGLSIEEDAYIPLHWKSDQELTTKGTFACGLEALRSRSSKSMT